MKKFLLMLSLLFTVCAAQADGKAPEVVIKEGTEKLQSLISANHKTYRTDLPGFYKVVDDVVVPYFDVPYIAKTVLARNYREATPEQRTRFQEAFKNMLIRSYANALLEYHDSVKVEWKPVRAGADANEVIVNSLLLRQQGQQPVTVGFALHKAKDQWKVYDIVIENISLVTNFRGQFSAEIRKSGLDSVIARMEGGQLQPSEPTTTKASGG